MKILVAVSGGVDSRVLLDLLAKRKLESFLQSKLTPPSYEICVAHFNHAMRKDANKHQKFVEDLAQDYGVKIFVGKAKKKLKSEEDARNARYAFFEKIAKEEGCVCIALAHHRSDAIETILFNLIRGCGLKGLGGMREVSENKWRPLLQTPKKKILEYAKKHKLKWVEDASNKDTKFSRNYLRKEIIPLLTKLNPKFEEAMERIAKLARENMDLMEMLAKEWLLRFRKGKSIALSEFNSLPPTLSREVIRLIYREEVGDLRRIEEKHIEEILELARNPRGNKKKQLAKIAFSTSKVGGLRVLKWS